MQKQKLLLIAEVPGKTLKEAEKKFDAFKYAIQASLEHNISMYQTGLEIVVTTSMPFYYVQLHKIGGAGISLRSYKHDEIHKKKPALDFAYELAELLNLPVREDKITSGGVREWR